MIKKSNKKFLFFVFFLLLFNSHSFAVVKQPFSVEVFCSTYNGQSNFLAELSKKILTNNAYRIELVKLLRNEKAKGCKSALDDYLNKFLENSINKTNETGFASYLLLAFASNLPVATKIIEKEIMGGNFIDWLDVFEKSDREAYFKTLSQWVERVAQLVRKLDKANTIDENMYGKMVGNENDIRTPESIPIWNPMLMNKYMNEVIYQKKKLTKDNFNNLNIIFSASNQSYREIFLTKMDSIISFGEINWILSFRIEPSWVQFRLLPVMGKVGGGLMKRELIWLSQNHQNFKMRSVAQSTLEKINNK